MNIICNHLTYSVNRTLSQKPLQPRNKISWSSSMDHKFCLTLSQSLRIPQNICVLIILKNGIEGYLAITLPIAHVNM